MNDPSDLELRDRLAGLASAVPVEASGSVTVVRPRIRPGAMGRRVALSGLVPVLAVVVIGTFIAGVAKVGPFAPGTSRGDGPVLATTTDGPFELTLRSAKARYTPDEPIEIEATLAYRGPEASMQIGHGIGAHSSPVGFGVDEPVLGDLKLSPSWDAMCVHSTLAPGERLTLPFEKSAGWSGDDPRSLEYRDYVLSPDMRLAEGTWHPYAVAEFTVGDCTTDIIRLRVDIEIQVLEPEPIPTAEPQATNTGQTATVRDGDFELTLRSDKTTYRPDELIEVSGSLVYRGPDDRVEIAHDSSGMILFGSRERVYGNINLSTATRLMCMRSVLERNVPVDMPFRKGGGFPGDHPNADFFRAFMLDPALRLPAGTWHLYAVSSGGCMAGPESPQFALEAEIAIEVSGEPVVIPPSAAPPAAPTPEIGPDASPGEIQPDGSVFDTENDGTFELRLRAAPAVYLAGEVIDLSAEFAYLGSEPRINAWSFHPIVGFDFRQLEGPPWKSRVTLFDSMCRPSALANGVLSEASMVKVGVHASGSVDDDWLDVFLADPTVRLPAGTWRVTASFSAYTDECTGEHNGLQASIDIKVVPVTGAEIELWTASESGGACMEARLVGQLALDERSGLGVLHGLSGEAAAVRWPFGFTARQEAEGAVLIDAAGRVVAREGEAVIFTGGEASDGTWVACEEVRVFDG